MFNKDPRDIDVTDPNEYFAYTAPNCSSKVTYYVLKSTLDNLKEGNIPEKDDFSTGCGGNYFVNTNGRYGGSACAAHFLKAKEIQAYVLSDSAFVKKAIEANITWFMPENVDLFVF